MKRRSLVLVAVLATLSAIPLLAQQAPPARRISPHETISARIGGGRNSLVTITYGRPYSKDPKSGEKREIWGKLVPWDKVWRMGSDEATTLITQQPIVMGDTTIPAGAYTLAMLPVQDGNSKLIVNKAIGQWGIPYTADLEKQELARIDIPKKETLDKDVDQFTMTVENVSGGGGVITMSWEKTKFSMPFTVKK